MRSSRAGRPICKPVLAMASFRDRFLTPRVARAMTSPSAILAVGAGAAAGILAGLGPIGAALGAGAAWAVRVLAAVPRSEARERVSPRSLGEPWRTLLADVQAARNRFADALDGVRPGPLRDRLEDLGARLEVAIAEAGRIARAGDLLSRGRGRIDVDAVRRDLADTERLPRDDRTQQIVRSLRSQLEAAERLDRTIADTHGRLRLLDARIDETVTRTVELSVTQVEGGDLGGLDREVDAIVGEMESLRQAVEETGAAWPTTRDLTAAPGTRRPSPGTGTT